MKNPIIFTLLLVALLFAVRAEGQIFNLPSDIYTELTKPEKKQWKKAAKEYKRNPKSLKVLTKEHEYYKQEAESLKKQIEHKDQQIISLESELKGIADLTENTLDLSGTVEEGIVFKLQIGAFEKVRLPEGLDDAKNVDREEGANIQKIVLGKFRNYDKAKKFQGYLKEMGIVDAWIVSYKDGVRVPIEEAIRIKP